MAVLDSSPENSLQRLVVGALLDRLANAVDLVAGTLVPSAATIGALINPNNRDVAAEREELQ
jgi:hypothetical protein